MKKPKKTRKRYCSQCKDYEYYTYFDTTKGMTTVTCGSSDFGNPQACFAYKKAWWAYLFPFIK